VSVAYDQPLLLHEGHYGYGTGFGIHGAVFGFDYLFYPAREWRRAPGFKLTVTLRVPDHRVRHWYGDRCERYAWRSNLALVDRSRRDVNALDLAGAFADLPADIFTLLFGLDDQ
jgi:hypothetical protein